MRRLTSAAGYSLAELTVTVLLMGTLAAIASGQFVGQQTAAKTEEAMGRLDSQGNAVMTWAAQQESFNESGSRLGGATLAALASAIENKEISQAEAEKILVSGADASSAPVGDDRTMVFTDQTLDGERIRLTRCEPQYFSSGDALCARMDLFPWGNNEEQAPTVVYRFLQCAGTNCGTTPPAYSEGDCARWPQSLPSRSGQAASVPACPSVSSASTPL